ncbi:hypothetical protein LX36DRAFT_651442 [Colletotrichum falcatum]|nr:hypothetical protein LX36DRAFT_651442 [Colletotrichum falcatum]
MDGAVCTASSECLVFFLFLSFVSRLCFQQDDGRAMGTGRPSCLALDVELAEVPNLGDGHDLQRDTSNRGNPPACIWPTREQEFALAPAASRPPRLWSLLGYCLVFLGIRKMALWQCG